jgi:protein phosphatase 1 regulatory subunit 7
MAIISIDGLEAYSSIDGTKSIIIDSNRIDKCMKIYAKHQLDGVAITTWRDHYNLQNVDFLSDYPEIKRLSISDGIEDISAIHDLHNLEWTIISGKKRKIDFSHFPSLKYYNGDWSSYLLNMDTCKYLEDLRLGGYSPKNKDCTSLPDVIGLKRLELVQSTICSLTGLEKFNRLEKLEFYYCSKLENLCCLEPSKETLTYLFFDHCKAIKNHDYVIKLSHLTTLAYNDCGCISSLNFLKKMPFLKRIMFVGTDVVDGDVTPCIGLDYAGFSNKRHFSHNMEEIKVANTKIQNTGV